MTLKERSVIVVGVIFSYEPVKITVNRLEVVFNVTYVTLVPIASNCWLLVVYDLVLMFGAVTKFVT